MKSVEEYIKEHDFVVFVTCGYPGSGKTTWCRKTGLPNVSRDSIRNVAYVVPYDGDYKYEKSHGSEGEVTKYEYALIMNCYFMRKSFTIDDTNGTKWRKDLLRLLKSLGAYIVGINFDTPLEICSKRRIGKIQDFMMLYFKRHHKFITPDEVDELITLKGY